MYEVLDENMDLLHKEVAKANKKTARHGLAPFTVTVTDTKITGTAKVHQVRLDNPQPKIEGWDFAAVMKAEVGGYLVHSRDETMMDGFTRPEVGKAVCDYCKTTRTRKTLYVLRNTETGEFQTLGSNCVEPFFGIDVSNLWMMNLHLEELLALETARVREGGTHTEHHYSVDAVLAAAYIITDKGAKYITTSDPDRTPTARTVKTILAGNFTALAPDEAAHARKVYHQARDMADDPIIGAIKSAADGLAHHSEYGANMRVALSSTHVTDRSVGLVASLVSVYARQEADKARAATVAGHLGQTGERLRGITGQVVSVRHYPSAYHDGDTSVVQIMAEGGHLAEWRSSRRADLSAGDTIVFDASVKDHAADKSGADLTRLTRLKVVA